MFDASSVYIAGGDVSTADAGDTGERQGGTSVGDTTHRSFLEPNSLVHEESSEATVRMDDSMLQQRVWLKDQVGGRWLFIVCHSPLLTIRCAPDAGSCSVSSQEVPGLLVSRSLGDTIGSTVGVTCTPEITCHDIVAPTDQFVLVASDGLWKARAG